MRLNDDTVTSSCTLRSRSRARVWSNAAAPIAERGKRRIEDALSAKNVLYRALSRLFLTCIPSHPARSAMFQDTFEQLGGVVGAPPDYVKVRESCGEMRSRATC